MNAIYERGSCNEFERPDLFFSERPAEMNEAQQLCAGCDVRISCLEFALENRIEWGVWGGVIFWDGEAFYRRRGRGRPRKDESNAPMEVDIEELRELVRSA